MIQGKVEICGVNTSKLPLLKNAEKEELFKRIGNGDEAARKEYINGNLRLVLSVIKRFHSSNENVDDLFQIGCIGLMKAVDHFDTSLNLAFSTYAVPMITGEIRRFLRDDGMVKVSRTLKEQGYKISKARERLVSALGREPDMAELSRETELSAEEIAMALDANREVESIYRPIYEKDGDELLMIDQVESTGACPGEEPEKEAVLNRIVIRQLLDGLSEQDRELIELRYFESRTQSEVAKRLGMSQVQVSRAEKRILLQLRKRIG